jgi:hypothetical protein
MLFGWNIDAGIFCLNELYQRPDGFSFLRADQMDAWVMTGLVPGGEAGSETHP